MTIGPAPMMRIDLRSVRLGIGYFLGSSFFAALSPSAGAAVGAAGGIGRPASGFASSFFAAGAGGASFEQAATASAKAAIADSARSLVVVFMVFPSASRR